MTIAQIKTLFAQAFKVKQGGPTNVTRAQPVLNALNALADFVAGLGTGNAVVRNGADVPANKRIAVADTIGTQVANGQQAMVLEPDGQWLGKSFKDNRLSTEPASYRCEQEVNPDTGATELYWNRYVIQ